MNFVGLSGFNFISAARLPATQRCAGGQVSTLHCCEMSAELTFRNQVGEQIVRIPQGVRPGELPGRAAASNVGGTGYVLSGYGRNGAAPSKLRFLGVVGAKL